MLQAQDFEQQTARRFAEFVVDDHGRVGVRIGDGHGFRSDDNVGLAGAGVVRKKDLGGRSRRITVDQRYADRCRFPFFGQRSQRPFDFRAGQSSDEAHSGRFWREVGRIERFQVVQRDRLYGRLGSGHVVRKNVVRSENDFVEYVRCDRFGFGTALADVVERPLFDHGERFLVPARRQQHFSDQRHDLRKVPLQAISGDGHRFARGGDPDLGAELPDRVFEFFGRPRSGAFVEHLCGQVGDSHLVRIVEQHTVVQFDREIHERQFAIFDPFDRHSVAEHCAPYFRDFQFGRVRQQVRFDAAVEPRRRFFVRIVCDGSRFGVHLLLADRLLLGCYLCRSGQRQRGFSFRVDTDGE